MPAVYLPATPRATVDRFAAGVCAICRRRIGALGLAHARAALAGSLGAYPRANPALHLAAVLPARRAAGPARGHPALVARSRGGGTADDQLWAGATILHAILR